MPPDRDQAYLWDMRQAAQEVSDLVLQLSAEEFRENRLTRLAVERLLIILGEAAMSVSEQYRLQHPEISWQQIQRLRNRLAHTYGSRGARPLYQTCRDFVFPLSLQLGSLVNRPPLDDPERSL